jgi:hypothetical protein
MDSGRAGHAVKLIRPIALCLVQPSSGFHPSLLPGLGRCGWCSCASSAMKSSGSGGMSLATCGLPGLVLMVLDTALGWAGIYY